MPLYPDPKNKLQTKIDSLSGQIASLQAQLAAAQTKLAQYDRAMFVLVDNDV